MLKYLLSVFIFCAVGMSFAQNTDSVWTLQECIDYAIQNNISLRQSQLTTENTEVTLEQSKANRIPTITGSASQGFSFGRSIDPTSNQYVNQTIRTNNITLSGSVILFNGFQIQNQIKQNRLSYEAGKFDVEAAQANLILTIAQDYFQILLAQEQVSNAKIQVESTKSQIERTQKQLNAGSVPEINVLQLQALLASDNLTLTNAENQVYLTKITLMQAMNMPVTNDFKIETPAEILLVPPSVMGKNTEEIYNEALGVQPSIKSLELKKESSFMGLKVAHGSKLPRLALNGQIFTNYSTARKLTSFVGYQQTTIGFLQSNPNEYVSTLQPIAIRGNYPFGKQLKDNISQSLNLSLSVPILNNRQARTNVDRATINIKQAQLQEESGKIQLRQNIEQAYANMRSAENSYNSSKQSLDLLEQTYLNAERRFNLGMLSPYDFVIQKNNYFASKYSFSQAKYQLILSAKVLEFYQKNQLQ